MGPEAGLAEALRRKATRLGGGSRDEASVPVGPGLGQMGRPVSQMDGHSLVGTSPGRLLPDPSRPAPKPWLSSKRLFPPSRLPRHSGSSSLEHGLTLAASVLQAVCVASGASWGL